MANDNKDFLRISQFDTAVSCECHMDDDKDLTTIAVCLAHLLMEEPNLLLTLMSIMSDSDFMETIKAHSVNADELFNFKNNKK